MITPFIPTLNLKVSQKFYEALGFVCQPSVQGETETITCHFEDNEIILQDYYVKDWAENTMLVMTVSDLDDWVIKIQSMIQHQLYEKVKLQGPKDFGWGKQLHVLDPAGVLWHVFEK